MPKDIPIKSGKNRKKGSGAIPRHAALNEQLTDPDRGPVSIHFERYLESQCEIQDLEGAEAREGVDSLKRIGSGPAHQLTSRNIRTSPVKRAGKYKQLYKGVTADTNVLHHNLGSGARLFYYMAGRKCFIVAFSKKHR